LIAAAHVLLFGVPDGAHTVLPLTYETDVEYAAYGQFDPAYGVVDQFPFA
jgi:hypothetical protein